MSIIKQIKRLTKDTFSYGLSSALQKLITIFLFPIYARLLTPADFGIQDVVLSVVNIMVMFLILGLDSAVMLYYYEANELDKKKMISTFLWVEQLVAIPVILITMWLAPEICDFFLKDTGLANYLRLGVAAIPFSLAVGAMQSTLRLTFKTTQFVIFTTVGIFFQLALTVLLVIYFKMGIYGILVAILLANIFQAILGAFYTYHEYIVCISFVWVNKLLKVGLPMIPAALSFWVMSYSNRFFLVNYASMVEVGLLSIVNRISSILLLFLSAFSSAWGPYAYSISTDRELARQTYSKVLTYFMLFSMSAGIGISIFSRELILVLATQQYERGAPLVFIYALSSILWVALYIVGMGTGIAKKNYHYTLSVILGAIINTLANLFLIPSYGIAGAAYATFAGNLVATIYMYYAGQFYFRVDYEFKKISLIVVITIVAVLTGNFVDDLYPQWSPMLLGWKSIIIILFLVLLFVSGVLQIKLIKQCYVFIRCKIYREVPLTSE